MGKDKVLQTRISTELHAEVSKDAGDQDLSSYVRDLLEANVRKPCPKCEGAGYIVAKKKK